MKLTPKDRGYITALIARESRRLRRNARDYSRKSAGESLEATDYQDRAAANNHNAAVLDAVGAAVAGGRLL